MIELNLLPKELRKKKKKTAAMPTIPVAPVCVGMLVLLVVSHLLLIFLIKNNRDLSVKLQNNWNQMQPQKEKTDTFFNELNSLQRRVEAIRKIAKPGINWARILSGLNQAMIPNMWLSEFKLTFVATGRKLKTEQEKPISLDLMGYAVGRSEVALPTVGRLMESLKKNNDFCEYFSEIELEDIRNYVISGEEVMLFKLVCEFKTEEEPAAAEKKQDEQGQKKKKKKIR